MDDRVAAGLANTIKALRAELNEAMTREADEPLRFALGAVTLDVELAITKDADADFGVRFWVLSLGTKGKVAREATNRLTLSLQPVVANADGTLKQALIAGTVRGEPE